MLSSGELDYFNGANDINTGLAVPIALTGNVSLRVYGAYSHTLVDLPATKPDTFWGGVKVTLCF